MAARPSLPLLPSLPPLDLDAGPGAGRPFATVATDQASSLGSSPLRKSISVDSFAASPTPRPPRDSQSPTPRGFVAGITSAFRRESVVDLRSRNRGASVGEQHQDREHRFRLPSFKVSDRRGELPAPREQPSTSAAAAGRVRSISSGAPSSPGSRRILINTQIPSVSPPSSAINENVTLIVIGVTGCGKSQAIRRGMSGYNLSDPLPSTVQRTVCGVSVPLYTYRLGTVVRDRFPDCPLTVIEIDVGFDDVHIPKNHLWPEAVPSIDGAVICYDAGDRNSFKPVEQLLRAYHSIKLPIIVLACKADLNLQIEPGFVSSLLNQYRAGLVEVSAVSDTGRAKLRRSFDWVLKAVFRHRQAIDTTNVVDHTHINPASPDILISPPQDKAGSVTPVTVHPPPPLPTPPPQYHQSQSPGYFPGPSENSITINELPSAVPTHQDHPVDAVVNGPSAIHDQGAEPQPSLKTGNETIGPISNDIQQVPLNKPKDKPKPAQFATLDALLNKLLFVVISGDDPNFISSFLLTYRRFCTPRSVLLAMQKKMRQLNESPDDLLFSSFAQMRICHLLEVWIADYPTDFAVNGSAGALNALIRSMLAKPHLLHYGSQLLPFLEVLPTLQDRDSSWAVQPEIRDESDVEDFLDEEEDFQLDKPEQGGPPSQLTSPDATPPILVPPVISQPASSARDRKPRPLMRSLGLVLSGSSDYDQSAKQQLKEFTRISNEIMALDISEVAEEITRVQAKYFLDITNRDWMNFVFLKQKRTEDPIVALNKMANHIGDWVVSLILCHDKVPRRARQMEKMVDIAAKLRALNNYSALRAFVAGINSAAYPGDETMELFKSRSPEHAKNLRSWELLLQQLRAHRAYRLALRNTKGACIPALEVHIADMVKTQESNRDHKEGDPTRIHWAKFSMMGRFVSITSQCQNQCRSSTDYNFPDRPHIRDLFYKRTVMSPELQRMRLKDPDDPDAQPSRKLFFW